MAYIQQQSGRPLMDHRLLEATTRSGEAGEVIRLLNAAQPRAPAADPVAIISIPDEGVTSDWDGVLHIAARRGHFDIVNGIPERWGAVDVSAKNKRGETALHCAAASTVASTSENAASQNALMIIHLISLARSDDEKRLLLRIAKHNGETCLHDAVRSGTRLAVETLVQADVSLALGPNDGRALVKILDNQGVSPLYLATTLRKLEIVMFLTQAKQHGDVIYPTASYAGPRKKTALHAAVLLNKELSKHLADWKSELIHKADESGNTPLHLLASTRDRNVTELLLDMDPGAGYRADQEGTLPIHVAAANGSLEIVKLLSHHRPNCFWSSNNIGQTILHIAVQNRRYYVVKYICSEHKFAPIFNTRDINGNTALHLAVLQGDQLIFCQLMWAREVYLSLTNKEERTPLDLAELSLPPASLALYSSPRQWIMYALILAGADYGTSRRDQFVTHIAQVDMEKESKSIGKSAGLVAVCAVLILTIAFAAPFTMTKIYSGSVDSSQKGSPQRALAYRIIMVSDAMAFAFSAIATSCCTFAGISFTDRKTRYSYLAFGGLSLRFAALSLIIVFAVGVYLAVAPIDVWITVAVCPFGLLVIVPQLRPIILMLIHSRALKSRLGFTTWWRTIFCALPQQRRDRIPTKYRRICRQSFRVLIFSVGLVCAIIYVCVLLSAFGR